MQNVTLLAYTAAVFGGGLAVASAFLARRSIARWSFVLGMALLAIESGLLGASSSGRWDYQIARTEIWRLIVSAALPGPWFLFSCTYARGDTLRFFRRYWIFFVGSLVLPLLLWSDQGSLIRSVVWHSEANVWVMHLAWLGVSAHLLILIASVAIVMNLERTFRAAIGTMRWRIKFALMGVGAIFVTRLYTSTEVLLFRGLDLRLEVANQGALIVATPLILWSFRRAGHFELDVYPSGRVLQGSLTILLAGIYLLVVGLLAKVVAFLGGDASFALKAFIVLIAVVLLAIALQSDRIQARLRRFVSRHFQRPLHDYRAIWRKFNEGTASRVEPGDLSRSLAALIAASFEALSVRIWLLNDRGDLLVLAAATSPGDHNTTTFAADPVVSRFAADPQPVDLDAASEVWNEALRGAHPSDFPNGGHRVGVPLLVQGELLGVITLGDRVNGTPFSTEDFELLTCIADHAAANLLNARLSQRLLQGKQLEAFQSMAAFFVHDLKNSASTLNLMLRNLPVHFDDPEFRTDALRGIAKTAEHINGLIGRLGALRHELKVEPVDADLNEIVTRAIAGLGPISQSTVEQDIQSVPRVPLDPEQVHKVITNLVLNAAEASAPSGHVRVATSHANGWVVLTVDDDGCGMTEEFMTHSLFRPFRTTKKHGLGIGMFQSKAIVEAHGGRIAVSSHPGTGTRFQVFLRTKLPIAGNTSLPA